MKLSFQHIIFCLSAIIGLTACSDDHDPIVNEDSQQSRMVFHLSCEADNDLDTRLVGDPGVAEEFLVPQYVYAIVAMDVINKSDVTESKIYVLQNSESKWRRNGRYFDGDVIFNKTNIYYDGMNSVESARAYIIVAPVALSFTNLSDCGFTQFSTDGQREDNATEEKIKNLIVAAHNDGVDLSGKNTLNLRDLYSTPFNLAEDGSEITVESDFKTKYYAKATKIDSDFDSNPIKISIEFGSLEKPIILYHTAAKVDFMWEAENPTQDNVMKSITVNNSPVSGYAFKPVANVYGTSYNSKYSTQVVGGTGSGTPIQVTWPTNPVDVTGATEVVLNDFFHVVGNNSSATLTSSGFHPGGTTQSKQRYIYFTPSRNGRLTVIGRPNIDAERYLIVSTQPIGNHDNHQYVLKYELARYKTMNYTLEIDLRAGVKYYVCVEQDCWITDLKFTPEPTVSLAPEQKWNGRAYSYVLQPQNYTLNYTITTTGAADEGDRVLEKDTNEQDMVLNHIYASWYLLRYKLKTSKN
ncbi:MAG: hypothetical protein KBT20_04955 [Bacteroidales bacterium]|nr:hypothetical protein [Candidatus Liminaster caballi]